MSIRSLKEQHFSETDLSRLMANLKEWTNQVTPLEILQGRLIEDLAVTTTATAFVHGLGRTPRGWIIVDKTADVRVWRTAWTSTKITLDSSGSATIAIWVF